MIKKQQGIFYVAKSKSRIKKMFCKFFPFPVIKAMNKCCEKTCYDAIHFLTGDFTLAFYFIFHKKDKKFYYTVHDLYPHEQNNHTFFETILHFYICWGYKINRNRILNLTTSSKLQLEQLKTLYPNKRVLFTHFPTLITPAIKVGKKRPPELDNIENYILFFGSLKKYKGVDLLIEAYNRSQKLHSLNLVIAGKGENYVTNNQKIIVINRYIEDEEISDLFGRAAFVVYPYRSATMSGVLSIAYYFNKLILASAIPFFLENNNSQIKYFLPNNVEDLQEKLEYLALRKISFSSHYEELYSDSILSNDYFSLYTN